MFMIMKSNWGRDNEIVGFYSTKVKAIKAMRKHLAKTRGLDKVFYVDVVCNKETKWTKEERTYSYYTSDITMTEMYKYLLKGIKSGINHLFMDTTYTISEVVLDTIELEG